jgi:DegV family protein with EDD domain
MIAIATDSACDLPPAYYREYDIRVVPINIQFGTETYRDGVDLDRAGFYRKVKEMGVLPSTSQPSSGQFERAYRQMMEEGAEDIVSVHVTAKLSGTYQSAKLAAEMLRGQVRVYPIDSACASGGQGFMAVEAVRMARAGKTVDEIMARMETLRERVNIVLTLDDLRYAQMSGRVGRLQSSLASLLNVKPIVLLEDGIVDVVEKVRTRHRALDRLIELMAERVGTSHEVNLAAIHADAIEEGQELLARAKSFFNCHETFLADLTTSLLVHLGPATLGLIAYRL